MQDLPHHYSVSAAAGPDGDVSVSGAKLDAIPCAAPAQFGGPGDRWSPETMLTAAVASCFILTFRAIARASKLAWISLQCEVEGTLERKDAKTRFTQFTLRTSLTVPRDAKEDLALRLLEKAEANCLVTNSLSSATHLDAVISKAE